MYSFSARRKYQFTAAIASAMLAEQESYEAVVFICEAVMVQKEAAERDRERTDLGQSGVT